MLESILGVSFRIQKLGSIEQKKGNLEMHYILCIKLLLVGNPEISRLLNIALFRCKKESPFVFEHVLHTPND